MNLLPLQIWWTYYYQFKLCDFFTTLNFMNLWTYYHTKFHELITILNFMNLLPH